MNGRMRCYVSMEQLAHRHLSSTFSTFPWNYPVIIFDASHLQFRTSTSAFALAFSRSPFTWKCDKLQFHFLTSHYICYISLKFSSLTCITNTGEYYQFIVYSIRLAKRWRRRKTTAALNFEAAQEVSELKAELER